MAPYKYYKQGASGKCRNCQREREQKLERERKRLDAHARMHAHLGSGTSLLLLSRRQHPGHGLCRLLFPCVGGIHISLSCADWLPGHVTLVLQVSSLFTHTRTPGKRYVIAASLPMATSWPRPLQTTLSVCGRYIYIYIYVSLSCTDWLPGHVTLVLQVSLLFQWLRRDSRTLLLQQVRNRTSALWHLHYVLLPAMHFLPFPLCPLSGEALQRFSHVFISSGGGHSPMITDISFIFGLLTNTSTWILVIHTFSVASQNNVIWRWQELLISSTRNQRLSIAHGNVSMQESDPKWWTHRGTPISHKNRKIYVLYLGLVLGSKLQHYQLQVQGAGTSGDATVARCLGNVTVFVVLLGRAWASPTLASLRWNVCVFVRMYVATYRKCFLPILRVLEIRISYSSGVDKHKITRDSSNAERLSRPRLGKLDRPEQAYERQRQRRQARQKQDRERRSAYAAEQARRSEPNQTSLPSLE